MQYKDLERMFNRSTLLSFSRKKFLFIFPVLLICGLLIVFCRALAFEANRWVVMSLSFLPVFLCSALLLSAGALMMRMYYQEVKGVDFEIKKMINQSVQLIVGVSYLSLPFLLSYLVVWSLMGVFHLIKAIPQIGPAVGVLLSFGPFLLVFTSIILSFLCLVMLFFITPQVALKETIEFKVVEHLLMRIRDNLFTNMLVFVIALAPLIFVVSLLVLAAFLTGFEYLSSYHVLGTTMQWLFIMIPFCAILTPFVVFFFNFATETFALLERQNTCAVRCASKD